MSGVNCTRRNSTPIARANALATNVLATPGTPSSSRWPPTVTDASMHLDHAVLADDDLANLPHHAIAQLVHVVLPSCCDNCETSATERERGVVVGGRVPDRGSLRFGVPERDRGAVDLFERGVGSEVRAPRDARARPLLHRRERVLRIAGAFERHRERAHVLGARRAAARARAGRVVRTAGSATTRAPPRPRRARAARSSTASGSRRARGSRRSRARLRRTRPAGARRPRARARTRRCRPARGTRSRAATRRRGRGSAPRPDASTRSASAASPVRASDGAGAGARPRAAARGSHLAGRCRAAASISGRRSTSVGAPHRRPVAEAVQVERIGAADHEAAAGARRTEQRGVVGVGERLRLDHEHRAGRVEDRVGERAALARDRDARSARASAARPPRPVSCVPYDEPATPLGSLPPTAWSMPPASRLSAIDAADHDRDRDAESPRRVVGARLGPSTRPRLSRPPRLVAPATTRGHSRRAVSRSGGSASRPP